MKTLGIIGGGRMGRQVADLADAMGSFSDVCFFDDYLTVGQAGVVGTFSDIDRFIDEQRVSHLTIAVGYRHFQQRQQLYLRYKGRIPFARCIHPSASVSRKAEIAEGALVYSMTNIEFGAVLEPNVTVLNQTSITHEVHVQSHCFLSVGVKMGGGVYIGSRTFVGVGATLVNDITIGNDCIICGGTFLTKSIPDNSCVIGNPYRVIDRVEL